jgi:UDP-glucose-4-epimerase GalE
MHENVLVTGGAGYIGSHTCLELKKNGFTPIVFDNMSTGHKNFVKWGPLEIGDLKSKSDLKRVFNNFDIKYVIHIAGKASVQESISDPVKYFEENINGTTNLLNQFIHSRGEIFIFSSSCATYGNGNKRKIKESQTQAPINPYGFTKLASENLIKYLAESLKFKFSILRYFNVAGASENLQIGELHLDETHVIPLLINSCLKKEIFTIFGNDFPTKDGTAIRDYVHVTDLAKAHISALNYNLATGKNITCNIGTGNGVSVLQLVNEIKKFDPNFKFEFKEKRSGDPAALVADVTISKILNWVPLQSDISTIINSALSWHKTFS